MAIVIYIIFFIIFYFARCWNEEKKRKLTERGYNKLIISKMFSKFRILNFGIKFKSFEFETLEFENMEFENMEFESLELQFQIQKFRIWKYWILFSRPGQLFGV